MGTAAAGFFFVVLLIYLWPLVAEIVGGVIKVRKGGSAHWEGWLNVLVLPFLVLAAAFGHASNELVPPWYVVLALAVAVDIAAFLVWIGACWLAARLSPAPPSST